MRAQRRAGGGAPISVLVVDDHPLYREMVGQVVGADKRLALVGEAADGSEALEKARSLRPDAVVLDAFMPSLGSDEVLRRLHSQPSAPRILLLAYGPTPNLHDALREDPDSLLYKSADGKQIRDEIVAMSDGDERSPGRLLLERARAYALARVRLSKHEVMLLEFKAAGMRDSQIAKELHCATRIVEEDLHAIRVKLEARGTTAAVAAAYELGLLVVGHLQIG